MSNYLSISGGWSSTHKRKLPPQYFTFAGRTISILVFAPIETMKKKNGVTTDVPTGKTNKEVSCDLAPYMIGNRRDNNLSSDNQHIATTNDAVDEEFMRIFTLSKFRKELILVGIDTSIALDNDTIDEHLRAICIQSHQIIFQAIQYLKLVSIHPLTRQC